MNQAFYLTYAEDAQVALFYPYFLEKRIRFESSVKVYIVK